MTELIELYAAPFIEVVNAVGEAGVAMIVTWWGCKLLYTGIVGYFKRL
jgi:hypothetical protein